MPFFRESENTKFKNIFFLRLSYYLSKSKKRMKLVKVTVIFEVLQKWEVNKLSKRFYFCIYSF